MNATKTIKWSIILIISFSILWFLRYRIGIMPNYGQIGNLEMRPLEKGGLESSLYLKTNNGSSELIFNSDVVIMAIKDDFVYIRKSTNEKKIMKVNIYSGSIKDVMTGM